MLYIAVAIFAKNPLWRVFPDLVAYINLLLSPLTVLTRFHTLFLLVILFYDEWLRIRYIMLGITSEKKLTVIAALAYDYTEPVLLFDGSLEITLSQNRTRLNSQTCHSPSRSTLHLLSSTYESKPLGIEFKVLLPPRP